MQLQKLHRLIYFSIRKQGLSTDIIRECIYDLYFVLVARIQFQQATRGNVDSFRSPQFNDVSLFFNISIVVFNFCLSKEQKQRWRVQEWK